MEVVLMPAQSYGQVVSLQDLAREVWEKTGL